ncbi:LysR family transcriptional regulator [Ramlibacter sp.]|uniref:LysR family transcriptional regulator n=1 Tax=Ramlibacter sp. TaxID=1917967 RepID=UPI001813BF88|nr:LysR family transcriptional regulator [Ramlibacter sp.]MBA2672974.1 LysR family transcriptional regulator [Ramlibacter sp.]
MKSPIAQTQYALGSADLQVLLALARGGTLAEAGARLNADASTVFRALQRIEKRAGQRLFERTRQGYLPSDAMIGIAGHAERIEAELEGARALLLRPGEEVSGRVRLTTVDTVLRGLVLPSLAALSRQHPQLQLELRASNEVMSLSKRDADLALRVLSGAAKPPEHVIGRRLGSIPLTVYAPRAWTAAQRRKPLDSLPWIAVDEALPEHPTVRWRRKQFPKLAPQHLVDGVTHVVDAIRCGLGVGVAPLFLRELEPQLVPLGAPLEGWDSGLWLLAHPESRHLRRIAVVYRHFAESIQLPP